MTNTRAAAVMACLLVLALSTCVLAQGGYARYTNARYGYGIDHPTAFRSGEAPVNNDGRSFKSGDGATLDVYGSNNVMNETVDSVMAALLAEHRGAVAYKTHGPNWFVVSWKSNGRIFYQKQFVGAGSMNTFILSYPATRRNAYAAIVTRMERSFRPGDLTRSH